MYFLHDFYLFVVMYMFSFYLVVGSNDWFMIWFGLEINMMMFIMVVYKRYSMFNIESCIKYFFIQSLGSAIFMGLFYLNKFFSEILLCTVLSYKMGAGPFFFWFPSICSGISWMSCFILMSLQKIIPLVLMSMTVSWVFFMIIFIGLMVGVFGAFNQLDLKRLMAYSSVYHLGWIMLCILVNSECWLIYLMMYMLMIFPMIFYVSKKNLNNLLEMIKDKSKFILIIVVLSMAGMPPFLGFFLKWFGFMMIMSISIFFLIVLVVCSVVMFYVYFRVIYDILLSYFLYSGWGSWSEGNLKKIWIDLLCVMGILFGMLVGFYLLF